MEREPIVGLIEPVLRLADEASRAILEVKQGALSCVEAKTDGSPVTLADRTAHRIIERGLGNLTPAIPILSEEGDLERSRQAAASNPERLFWLVDPLDGTKEFVQRYGDYTVNIALVQNAQPILGVIRAPQLDVAYYAALGAGAFRQEERGGAIPISANSKSRTPKVVASRAHFSEKTERFVNQLGEYELVRRGSSIKICSVAEGKADVYPRLGPTFLWDTAAGVAVAREAGCTCRDLNNQELSYSPTGDLRHDGFVVFSARLPGLSDRIWACNDSAKGLPR